MSCRPRIDILELKNRAADKNICKYIRKNTTCLKRDAKTEMDRRDDKSKNKSNKKKCSLLKN